MPGEKVRSDGYYRWFPGDYLRDTGTLSLIEHGAYRLLLDHYYSESGGIADEKPRLYRLCRATTPEEQRAVDFIVKKYFPINNGMLTNSRADKELKEREQFIEEQKRKGSLGGRPRKNPEESRGFNPGFENEPNKKAGAKPNESPASASASASALPPGTPSKDQSQKRVPEKPGTRARKGFVKPSLEEVTAYCVERKNGIDPGLFIDSNEAKGWVVGTTRSPMKDWKATIRTWERRNGSGAEAQHGQRPGDGKVKATPGKYSRIGTVIGTESDGVGEAGAAPEVPGDAKENKSGGSTDALSGR